MIDVHCHVYPDEIAERAVGNIGGFYDTPIVCDGRVDTVLREQQKAGVTHTLISSVATTPHQVASINRYLSAVSKAHPESIDGLGTLHPYSPDQQADVEYLLTLGLKGIKLHPDIQKVPIDASEYLAIFELCQDTIPVLCHLGDSRYDFSNPERVKRVLNAFPHLRLVGAHFGGWSVWRQAAEELHSYANFRVDCSSSLSYLTPEEATEVVRLYGAERVLYGSDYPMWHPSEELGRFDRMDLTREERSKILYSNAATLFGIDQQ